ncbi:MAG TPA: DPP IV N-terminal domain-containing protein [Gemmatimonadaceae bacterium]|nr:DPP IV N-terminal domain-containing protein [Gemmatimonadaceae bacterium]
MRCRLVTFTLLAASAAILPPAAARAQQPGAERVTLNRLFASEDFVGDRFGPSSWFGDSAYTTLEPSTGAQGGMDVVRYDAATGRRDVLVSAARLVPSGRTAPLDIQGYSWSPDRTMLLVYTNSRRVWRQNTRGDYWVLDLHSGRLRQLGGPAAKPSTLMFATFSPDGHRVAYVREHNLYVEDLRDGRITQLTHDGSPTIINGTFDWVYEEELNLRDGFRWSPDGTHIAYWQLDASGVRDFDLIDDTDSLYSFVKPVQYPKAGSTNSAARVGVVSAAGGPTVWLTVPGDPRNNYIARMQWADTSSQVVLQQLNRGQDTLRVMLGDAHTGAVHTVLTETDSTWVSVVDDLRWLDDGKAFTWVSERDGWTHLYVVSRDGKSTRLVTKGDYDLDNPESAFAAPLVEGVDQRRGWIYFTASPDNPTQLYLYRTRMDGRGTAVRVTPAADSGTNLYDISPGAHWAIHTYSSFGMPPVTELVHLPDHRVVRTLVSNARLKATVAALEHGPSGFFRVKVGNGVALDGWMMKPPHFDSTRTYPILFYVYGEPAAQTVLDEWGGSTYLWHLMLTQQGYIVASVDNRGTPAPRGRAWRTAIYKKIGTIAVEDQTAAARAILRHRAYIDPSRVGVWGWSGGGSSTLSLLFRSPDVYKMGMAVAPVTNQRFYDTIYEERYMGTPQANPEAYRESSPITYAANLQGDLLLVHGSGDDNVHFQNSEALINALVAANKPFTMMDYPNRTHCICEGKNTSRHLFELLTRYLHGHLPAGPRPREGQPAGAPQ